MSAEMGIIVSLHYTLGLRNTNRTCGVYPRPGRFDHVPTHTFVIICKRSLSCTHYNNRRVEDALWSLLALADLFVTNTRAHACKRNARACALTHKG